MKKNIFSVLGLMSGTSMDGVDISLIKTDGYDYFEQISNKFYEFSDELYKDLIFLRESISELKDLDNKFSIIDEIEKKFTLFNAQVINEFIKQEQTRPEIIGFHGQTIYHNSKAKISKHLGDGNLLSQLTNCTVVNNFRKQDIDNSGQGAPLTPIFHYLISKQINKKKKLTYPLNIINIGGITNVSTILGNEEIQKEIFAYDIAPGNCLIDEWVRKNSNKKFDENGFLASSGKVNELILNQSIDNFQISSIKDSMDINDFDISFAKGLNLEDGCSTLNEFTAYLISEGLKKINQINNIEVKNLLYVVEVEKIKNLLKIFINIW
jgi:anhydro-N-acetylmuramic acid kinase